MEKVTKWHCAVFERYVESSWLVNDRLSSHAVLAEYQKVLAMHKKPLPMPGVTIVLWPITVSVAMHARTDPASNRAHAYGTKKQALRGVLPRALELLAGDMVATVKLMKFMEDNGLDLEEEALE